MEFTNQKNFGNSDSSIGPEKVLEPRDELYLTNRVNRIDRKDVDQIANEALAGRSTVDKSEEKNKIEQCHYKKKPLKRLFEKSLNFFALFNFGDSVRQDLTAEIKEKKKGCLFKKRQQNSTALERSCDSDPRRRSFEERRESSPLLDSSSMNFLSDDSEGYL